MEGIKPIPYKKNNTINNPLLEYYSYIANPNNVNNKSESLKLNDINIPNNENTYITKENINKDSINNINLLLEEKPYTQKNNNFKLKSEINTKNDESDDNIDKNKEIKKIKPEDLINTNIKNKTFLRINPSIYEKESYEFFSSNLYILLKDQFACKFLQEKLEKDTYNCLSHIFPALIPNIKELIKDSFANYFIQKMFGYLNEEQIEYILKILEPDFLEICKDKHGTRVIQGLMDYLITEKNRNYFFEIIKPIFPNIINEYNGTHIIYKFLQFFPEFFDAANDIIKNNIVVIGTNKRGCTFLQNHLSGLSGHEKMKENIIQSILSNCLTLIIDPFGNYIIQYLLTLEDSNITLNIINQIINNVSFYSKHRYANYVIEKIFIYSNYTQKLNVIQKIATKEIITDLSFNQQGNFIILKALKVADNDKRKTILEIINSIRPKILELPEGKIFLKKIEKFS